MSPAATTTTGPERAPPAACAVLAEEVGLRLARSTVGGEMDSPPPVSAAGVLRPASAPDDAAKAYAPPYWSVAHRSPPT